MRHKHVTVKNGMKHSGKKFPMTTFGIIAVSENMAKIVQRVTDLLPYYF